MTVRYNVTGSERKRLANALAQALGKEYKYLKAPTFAYQVGGTVIDQDGTVIFDDQLDPNKLNTVIAQLRQQGFTAKADDLRISVPLEDVNLENLTALLDSKGPLIRKALGVDGLPVELDQDRVYFPWFTGDMDTESLQAYTHLIRSLCRMSRDQSRINKTHHTVENERYAFRCFLLRLGFVGSEYKTERKILLRNLTGSAAFKSGSRKEDQLDAVSQ